VSVRLRPPGSCESRSYEPNRFSSFLRCIAIVCVLSVPNRALPIMASAIQRWPPCRLTRLASAGTCPRSRGSSTRGTCTAWPCRPARASHVAPVRSSNPKATPIAGTGQPWASEGTSRTIRSAAERSREQPVPGVAETAGTASRGHRLGVMVCGRQGSCWDNPHCFQSGTPGRRPCVARQISRILTYQMPFWNSPTCPTSTQPQSSPTLIL